ncbi:CRAL/TRIO domain-containingprotein [Purpureocillium lavendulum]|uniref:CRAL/TRIO domain-containingprotein n=1 Tax=Purpureocillium lavendulum TaxID=1247861 RepID=A0AB34FTT0_9HYPO|nr:CRAL/TRIO domain-containingprotein [Purpureocillium lavendulum]
MQQPNKIQKRPPSSIHSSRLSFVSTSTRHKLHLAGETVTPGYLGNLTQPQEAKLRALWAIGIKFVEICEADSQNSNAKSLEEKYVPLAKKSSYLSRGEGRGSATHQKYPGLVNELLSLLPTDEHDVQKLARQAVDALDHWTPEMYHLIVMRMVKCEHPDALGLRFLRACKWDLIQATKMMGKAIYWRSMEAAVDDDIMKRGEAGAAEDEKNGFGPARTVSTDFMNQIRSGKAFIHGTDRAGRPISYIRLRLHKASDQCYQSLERYTVYLLELARLSLRAPIETGTILIDMTGFVTGNIDLSPLKFIINCVQTNYPESLGLLLIHNAPLGFKTMWKVLRFWLDPAVASKVQFTRGKRGLLKWIAPDQLLKELGGNEDWEYEYEEPLPDENIKMQDTRTRDRLLAERQVLAQRFEELTKEWVMSAQLSDKSRELCGKRDKLAGKLTANYWQLDPYIRARSIYDRHGYFRGADGAEWYSPKAREALTIMVPPAPEKRAMADELSSVNSPSTSDGMSTLRRASVSDGMSTLGRTSTFEGSPSFDRASSLDDDDSFLDEVPVVEIEKQALFISNMKTSALTILAFAATGAIAAPSKIVARTPGYIVPNSLTKHDVWSGANTGSNHIQVSRRLSGPETSTIVTISIPATAKGTCHVRMVNNGAGITRGSKAVDLFSTLLDSTVPPSGNLRDHPQGRLEYNTGTQEFTFNTRDVQPKAQNFPCPAGQTLRWELVAVGENDDVIIQQDFTKPTVNLPFGFFIEYNT